MGIFKNLTGVRFGKFTVAQRDSNNAHDQTMWLCVCSCDKGGTTLMRTARILRLIAKNSEICCQDLKPRTGYSDPNKATYAVWANMKSRCLYPKHPEYPRYGGEGIKVCDRWLSYSNFVADMGLKPAGFTLERKDNDGDYNRDNCKWATPQEQARNRRSNVMVEYRGQTRTLIEWCELLNLPYGTVQHRITSAKWPVKKAFETPIMKRRTTK